MSETAAFAIDCADPFVVDRNAGWLSFIAGYTRFPDPPRELDGWPVLVSKDGVSPASLRALLAGGFLWDVGGSA